jgi:hypothetical protein
MQEGKFAIKLNDEGPGIRDLELPRLDSNQ